MPIMKRATAQLQQHGIALIVVKRLWGYSLENPAYQRQQSRCHNTVQDAIDAAIAGERPMDLTEERSPQ